MEGDGLFLQLLLLFVLIVVSGTFSCAEVAFISVQAVKLEQLASKGNRKARRLLTLTNTPAKFLAVVQAGSTFSGFLASAFAADSFSYRLTAALSNTGVQLPLELIGTVSLVGITILLAYCTIVLGELVPRRIGLRYPQQIALALSTFIIAASYAFAPAVWLLTKSANALLKLFRINVDADRSAVTEEEIRLLVDAGSKRGAIADREKEIIHNVFEFNDKTVETVMTHRRNVTLLWLKDDDECWEQTVLGSRHSHYPVCGDSIDDIRAVLNSRDYLSLKDRRRELVMQKAFEEAWFVPVTVGTHVLLRKMQARRSRFALALDEYGSFDGIITMHDLLQAIVGNLEDKEAAALPIEQKEANLWHIHGSVTLGMVEKETGIVFDTAGKTYGTFGGFVFTLLGRVPDDDEQCQLTHNVANGQLHITILQVKDRRLESALIQLTPKGSEPPPPSTQEA